VLPAAVTTAGERADVPRAEKPAPRASGGGLSMLDSLIDAAPEVSEMPVTPAPAPWKSEQPAEEPKAPVAAPAAVIEDSFHNDPLIQAALKKFEGKVLN